MGRDYSRKRRLAGPFPPRRRAHSNCRENIIKVIFIIVVEIILDAAHHPLPFTEWVFLGCALLTLGGFVAWSLFDEHAALETREREHLAVQARIVPGNLGRQLDAGGRMLGIDRDELPRWRRKAAGMARANERLQAFTDAMPGVRTIVTVNRAGIIEAATVPAPIGRDFSERDYFQAPLRRPDAHLLYVSPPFKTALGAWSIHLTRMIPGPGGEFAGVITAPLDPNEFRILLDSVNHAPDMWSALAHGDGELFLTMPERPDLAGADLARPGSPFGRRLSGGAYRPATKPANAASTAASWSRCGVWPQAASLSSRVPGTCSAMASIWRIVAYSSSSP